MGTIEDTEQTSDQGADVRPEDMARSEDAPVDAQDMGADEGVPPGGMDMGADAGVPEPVGVMARVPDGRFGEPMATFTLPEVADGERLRHEDIQAAFPEVDWSTLDRLYIPAGDYLDIILGNLPERSMDAPLVITNLGGQVRAGGGGSHPISLRGGSGWVLSGRYDPISKTGDAGFPGHRDNVYAHTADTYGIVIDDDFTPRNGWAPSGMIIGGGATEFEVEFVEIREVEFAGMLIKTDHDADATMANVRLHDLYIHDVISEGVYIGNTGSAGQHRIDSIEFDHNRVLRTGTEAVQISHMSGTSRMHHNVIGPAALDWRAAFQHFQNKNMQLNIRSGQLTVDHNVIVGAAGVVIEVRGLRIDGDPHGADDAVRVADNYISNFRNLAFYFHDGGLENLPLVIERNVIRAFDFTYDQVYPDDERIPFGHLVRLGAGRLTVQDNRFDAEPALCNAHGDDCNGSSSRVEGQGNVRTVLAPFEFRNSGFMPMFDYQTLEVWAPVATLNDDAPVVYPMGMLVMHHAVPYRCVDTSCASSDVPGDSEAWERLDPFPDDVRSMEGEYDMLGLGVDG